MPRRGAGVVSVPSSMMFVTLSTEAMDVSRLAADGNKMHSRCVTTVEDPPTRHRAICDRLHTRGLAAGEETPRGAMCYHLQQLA